MTLKSPRRGRLYLHGVTVHWSCTCCLRCAVGSAIVQLGLGNPTEVVSVATSRGSSAGGHGTLLSVACPSVCRWEPILFPHQGRTQGYLLHAQGQEQAGAAHTKHPEKPSCKQWLRLQRLLQDWQLITLVCTHSLTQADTSFKLKKCLDNALRHDVILHVQCRARSLTWWSSCVHSNSGYSAILGTTGVVWHIKCKEHSNN